MTTSWNPSSSTSARRAGGGACATSCAGGGARARRASAMNPPRGVGGVLPPRGGWSIIHHRPLAPGGGAWSRPQDRLLLLRVRRREAEADPVRRPRGTSSRRGSERGGSGVEGRGSATRWISGGQLLLIAPGGGGGGGSAIPGEDKGREREEGEWVTWWSPGPGWPPGPEWSPAGFAPTLSARERN